MRTIQSAEIASAKQRLCDWHSGTGTCNFFISLPIFQFFNVGKNKIKTIKRTFNSIKIAIEKAKVKRYQRHFYKRALEVTAIHDQSLLAHF